MKPVERLVKSKSLRISGVLTVIHYYGCCTNYKQFIIHFTILLSPKIRRSIMRIQDMELASKN